MGLSRGRDAPGRQLGSAGSAPGSSGLAGGGHELPAEQMRQTAGRDFCNVDSKVPSLMARQPLNCAWLRAQLQRGVRLGTCCLVLSFPLASPWQVRLISA